MKCSCLFRLLRCLCDGDADIRIIPGVRVTEQSGPPPEKTPQHHRPFRHRKGDVIVALTMTDSQQSNCTVAFVDKKGNPAPVDGTPTWSTDNSDVLAVTPAADGMSCVVKAVGPLGTGNVQVNADADLGAGVVPIIGVLAVTITGGTATVVTITPGTPTEQGP